MSSPGASELRCQVAALRYAAKRSHKLSVIAGLIAHARRLQLAERLEQENRGRSESSAREGRRA
jgi:hypothetical protein